MKYFGVTNDGGCVIPHSCVPGSHRLGLAKTLPFVWCRYRVTNWFEWMSDSHKITSSGCYVHVYFLTRLVLLLSINGSSTLDTRLGHRTDV